MATRSLLLAALMAFPSLFASAGVGGRAIPDSIGHERKGNKNLVLYKVEGGETLFGITRKYRTTVGEVQRLNPGLAGAVKVGQVIKVPALSNTAPAGATAKTPASGQVQKVHVVTSGQTLFAIARQYKVAVADIQLWNNLSNSGLVEGQQLVVSKPDASSLAEPAPGGGFRPIEAGAERADAGRHVPCAYAKPASRTLKEEPKLQEAKREEPKKEELKVGRT